MTDQEINTPVNDADLLADAFSTEAPAAEVVQPAIETPAPVTTERPRDDAGRFAPKEQAAATEGQDVHEKEANDAHVPSWRLREVSEARRAAEKLAEEASRELRELRAQVQSFQRQQQQPTQPQQDPDWFDDPRGATLHAVAPLQEMVLSAKMRADRLEAAFEFSKEEVSEAEKAFNEAAATGAIDPNEHRRINSSPNPFAAAIDWHRRNRVLSEVGTDPNAWLEKKLEERMNDPAFLQQALDRARGVASQPAQGGSPVTRLPPSLNRASGSSGRTDQPGNSDADLLKSMFPGR
jgi:hypothetical protein